MHKNDGGGKNVHGVTHWNQMWTVFCTTGQNNKDINQTWPQRVWGRGVGEAGRQCVAQSRDLTEKLLKKKKEKRQRETK